MTNDELYALVVTLFGSQKYWLFKSKLRVIDDLAAQYELEHRLVGGR